MDDLCEGVGHEAGATDERAVDLLFGHERVDVVGLNGTPVENARVVGGLWVQLCYGLIDVCCVVANGALAWIFRFSARDFRYPNHLLAPGQHEGAHLASLADVEVAFLEQGAHPPAQAPQPFQCRPLTVSVAPHL